MAEYAHENARRKAVREAAQAKEDVETRLLRQRDELLLAIERHEEAAGDEPLEAAWNDADLYEVANRIREEVWEAD